jgi:hypothetical protein
MGDSHPKSVQEFLKEQWPTGNTYLKSLRIRERNVSTVTVQNCGAALVNLAKTLLEVGFNNDYNFYPGVKNSRFLTGLSKPYGGNLNQEFHPYVLVAAMPVSIDDDSLTHGHPISRLLSSSVQSSPHSPYLARAHLKTLQYL